MTRTRLYANEVSNLGHLYTVYGPLCMSGGKRHPAKAVRAYGPAVWRLCSSTHYWAPFHFDEVCVECPVDRFCMHYDLTVLPRAPPRPWMEYFSTCSYPLIAVWRIPLAVDDSRLLADGKASLCTREAHRWRTLGHLSSSHAVTGSNPFGPQCLMLSRTCPPATPNWRQPPAPR